MGDDGKMPLDGSFGKTMPLCVGDPYHDPKMSGTHGVSKGQRQFLTTPGKKGQTANAVGYGPLEFKTLFSGGKDQYEDPHKMHVKERLKNVILRRGPAGEPRPRDGKTPSQRLAEIQAQRRIPAPSKGRTGKQAKSARPSSAPGTRDSSESRFAKSPARSPAKYLRKGGAYEVASRYKSPKGKVDLMPVHRHRSPRKPQGRYAL